MLTSKQRAALRKEAGQLSPVFQVGKGGIDHSLVKATGDCLAAREPEEMGRLYQYFGLAAMAVNQE